MSQMLQFAAAAEQRLSQLKGEDYAIVFVELRMEFFRLFQGGLITSTDHGLDFFKHILAGPKSWDEKGEYGDNFRKIFKLNEHNTTNPRRH